MKPPTLTVSLKIRDPPQPRAVVVAAAEVAVATTAIPHYPRVAKVVTVVVQAAALELVVTPRVATTNLARRAAPQMLKAPTTRLTSAATIVRPQA